jgi:abortive infection bacteriophage resistance protein
MKFTKPALSIPDQVALLTRRGMAVPDQARAEHYLRHISYYRLRAYWLPFEQPAPAAGDHMFRAGTSFEDALQLYMFDRHLRLLVMDAIERIEVSLRGGWAHSLALKYWPHGYIEPAIYSDPLHHAKALTGLVEEILRAKDTFIAHYNGKYTDPQLPPVWMAAEILSLGQLSKWIGNLTARADRQAIAKAYGLDEKALVSIAHHLTYIRNICAHHGRLWNKQFTVTMMLPNSPAAIKLAMNPLSTRRIYNTLATIGYLLNVIAPGSTWKRSLVALLDEYPLAPPADMGFPANWRAMPAWRIPAE